MTTVPIEESQPTRLFTFPLLISYIEEWETLETASSTSSLSSTTSSDYVVFATVDPTACYAVTYCVDNEDFNQQECELCIQTILGTSDRNTVISSTCRSDIQGRTAEGACQQAGKQWECSQAAYCGYENWENADACRACVNSYYQEFEPSASSTHQAACRQYICEENFPPPNVPFVLIQSSSTIDSSMDSSTSSTEPGSSSTHVDPPPEKKKMSLALYWTLIGLAVCGGAAVAAMIIYFSIHAAHAKQGISSQKSSQRTSKQGRRSQRQRQPRPSLQAPRSSIPRMEAVRPLQTRADEVAPFIQHGPVED